MILVPMIVMYILGILVTKHLTILLVWVHPLVQVLALVLALALTLVLLIHLLLRLLVHALLPLLKKREQVLSGFFLSLQLEVDVFALSVQSPFQNKFLT